MGILDKVFQILQDNVVAKIDVDFIFLGTAGLLLVGFLIFAISRCASAAKKRATLLNRVAKAVSAHGIQGPEDSEAIERQLSACSDLSFRWKRFAESEVLTPYDAFRGKPGKVGGRAFAGYCGAVLALGTAATALYLETALTLAQTIFTAGIYALVAILLWAIYRGICRAQVRKAVAAEQKFAQAIAEALPAEEIEAPAAPAPVAAPAEQAGGNPEGETHPVLEEVPASEAPAEKTEEPMDEQIAVEDKYFEPEEPPKEGVEAIIAKINEVRANGASVETLQEIARLLQREREKPENKTAAQQRRLNEALAELLRAMSRYQK